MAGVLDLDKLIEAIRSKPPVWNRNDPMHRIPEVVRDLWDAIFIEMGGKISVPELKQKWQILRVRFRREERSAKKKKRQTNWCYNNQLQFLKTSHMVVPDESDLDTNDNTTAPDFPTKIETSNEFDLNNANSDESEFIENENLTHKIMIKADDDMLDDKLSNKSYENESNEKTLILQTEVTNEEEEDGRKPYENDANPLRAGEASNRRAIASFNDNDDYHFGMSIIPHMKQVPTHRKLRMRIRILEIITEEANYDET